MTMPTLAPLKNTKKALSDSILGHIVHDLGSNPGQTHLLAKAHSLGMAINDRLVEKILETQKRFDSANCKRVYYLSIEYLIGRCLSNNLINLGLYETCKDVFEQFGESLEEAVELEHDPALGNGGLGRLAACYLDSLATMGLPAVGYGIHYEYGLFRQTIENGYQRERPDFWMAEAMPLQLHRPYLHYPVRIYGRIKDGVDAKGEYAPRWVDWETFRGVAYDIPIAGYGGRTVNILRLFAARASSEFNMDIFNSGDYLDAVKRKVESETVSKVLYPREDVTYGRELRLIQEYFLVSCALQDIIHNHLRLNPGLENFDAKAAIHLNDTHPSLAVPELLRLLIDEHRMSWDEAWAIAERTFAFTNHTLMPEALEIWPVSLMERLLPRHLQIIYEINSRFLGAVAARYPGDKGKLARMSLIEEGPEKKLRMASLAVAGSHSVNGVSKLHSGLIATRLFPDYFALWPDKFNNKTNGVTPRRWLLAANPELAGLISEAIGPKWITDLDELRGLAKFAGDASFRQKFMKAKSDRKAALSNFIRSHLGQECPPDAIFDMQAKRIHEYKRQLLNCLHIIWQYLRLTEDNVAPVHPKAYIFAGKAAPGYFEAKQIIKLINNLGRVINADPKARGHLSVFFLPDYRVTLAERMIPAADVSEQISTAGTEASGTGNMKFSLNGALTVGAWDGANIEICEEVGEENIYIFGLRTEDIATLEKTGYAPGSLYNGHPEIKRVLDALREDRFCPDEPGLFHWMADKLLSSADRYYHLADFIPYAQTQERIENDYTGQTGWAKKAILNVAGMGRFSSDRAVSEYCRDIWNIGPVA
ncbi:MAG: glycogen/starch/alpha-glucan phosphorylase [Desulfovibrionaceae bacterium]|nr:glycogen/starch/alpha-glucan phosphorylase [Desulfovibrionaceae bacterium]MBF0514511.1 glycogen/starch/alpha-glucan phosphorylase [Desulfovibrionaceae bacterium]